MPLREQLIEIREDWPRYLGNHYVDKGDPIFRLVTEQVPRTLTAALPEQAPFKLEGSTGRGLITAAPWVATFHRDITTSATSGYYLVYLVSVDLERVYLVLGLGATQFDNASKGKRQQYARMDQACERLRGIFSAHIPSKLKERILTGIPDIASGRRSKLHRDYEHGAVFYLQYDLASLPDEADLLEDYKSMVELYEATVADPLTPSTASLLGGTVDLKNLPRKITVDEFTPLTAKAKSHSSGRGYRPNKESKVTGDVGEQIAIEHERKKLSEAGLGHLVSKIVHEEAEGQRPGWDISSFDDEGEPIFIEVKASEGHDMPNFELTANEWTAATGEETRDKYKIYLVTQALSSTPHLTIIGSPYGLIDSGKVEAKPSRYMINLVPTKAV